MVRKGWSSMDVPSGWVQIIRGPHLPSQWPKSHEQKPAEPSESGSKRARDAPPGFSGTSSSPGSCKEQDLERALEAMGGMEGPAVQAVKWELEKTRSARGGHQLGVTGLSRSPGQQQERPHLRQQLVFLRSRRHGGC